VRENSGDATLLLMREGFLTLTDPARSAMESCSRTVDWSKTQAYRWD